VAVWLLTRRLGIEGAAIAFTGRIVVDTCLMFFFADRMLQHRPKFMFRLTAVMAAGLLVLGVSILPQTFTERVIFSLVALLAFALATFVGMAPDERDLVRFLGRKPLKVKSSRVK